MNVTGRVWKFGQNINTDLMYPTASFKASDDERKRLVFSALRPDWSSAVRPGDLIVAGDGFGTGSGRPAPRYLKMLGIVGIVADSINGLFFRNSYNYGLPALECPGVADAVTEGDDISVDFLTGEVIVPGRGSPLQGGAVPAFLVELARDGGIVPQLRSRGLLDTSA